MIYLKLRPRLARSPPFYVSRFLHISFPAFFIATCFGRDFACVGTGVGDSPTTIRLHARHAQRALEQTSEASKPDNVELKAQVYLNHTSGCIDISQRRFQMARSFLTKGCSAINVANLQFIPAFGLPPELAEEVQEGLEVLSQLVYLENYPFSTIDHRMKSKMTTRLEKDFQRELQARITITGLTCDPA